MNMNKLAQLGNDSKPARRRGGHVFGQIEGSTLTFHIREYSRQHNAISVDAFWWKSNRDEINLIVATVDSLDGCYCRDRRLS